MKKTSSHEEKASSIIDFILDKFRDLMSLDPFTNKVDDLIADEYKSGLETIETQLKPNINFVAKEKTLEFLQNYVNQNLQTHSDAVGDSLRQEIQRSILNGDSIEMLKERVREVFKDKTYTQRLKTVIRTESIRANNLGRLEGAEQAATTGLKLKKWIDIIDDNVTTDICLEEHAKYGSPDKAIPLDQDFEVKVGNKTYIAQYPPFHINCRSVLRIEVVE